LPRHPAVAYLRLVRRRKEDTRETKHETDHILFVLLIGWAGTQGNVMSEAANGPALAEDYPTKPVQLIEPFGTAVDLICWRAPSPSSSLNYGANL
jgi:hypothetical protein